MKRVRMLGPLLFVAAVLVAACGDGDDSVNADASPALGVIDVAGVEAYAASLQSTKEQFDEDVPLLETNVGEFDIAEELRKSSVVLSSFATTLDELAPPSELLESHVALVSVTSRWLEVQLAMADDIDERGQEAANAQLNEGVKSEWLAAVCDVGTAIDNIGVAVSLGCSAEELAESQPFRFERRDLVRGVAACTAVTKPSDDIHYGQVTLTVFVNIRDEPVDLHRFDVSLQSELIATLEPGEESAQVHPLGAGWTVSNLEGTCLGGIRPEGGGGSYLVIGPDVVN